MRRKKLRAERQGSRVKKRRPKKPRKPLRYKQDPNDPKQLILRNGTRLRRSYDDVDLYTTENERIYSLTRYGLRPLKIQRIKKRNYGKKTRSGTTQGQRYPYIMFRGHKYEVHVLVTLAWLRARESGEEIDHINGNIDDCRLINLRIISAEENDRCAGILRRLRNASVKYNLPELNPLNTSREELIERFERYKGLSNKQIARDIRMEMNKVLLDRI